MSKIIQVNLVRTITFFRGTNEFVIPVDSVVIVHVNEGYAIWYGIHFEIFQHEYILTV